MANEKKHNVSEVQDEVSSEKAKAIYDASAESKLNKAHDTIEHPDKFAEIFIKAAKSQTVISEYLESEVQTNLSSDQIKKTIKNLVEEHFKESWKSFLRSNGAKIGFAIWTIAILVLGAWLKKFF
jgi:hypothetical protein